VTILNSSMTKGKEYDERYDNWMCKECNEKVRKAVYGYVNDM